MSDENLSELLKNITIDPQTIHSQIKTFNQSNLTKTIRNMATPPDYQLLKLSLDTIPNYDGNPKTLSVYLSNANYLITQYGSPNNVTLNKFLVRALLGKLTGRALMLIGSRTELSSWEEIKKILVQSFGDQRDIDCLVQDLLLLKPVKGETPYQFGMRCQDHRCLITSKINMSEFDQNEKIVRMKSYDDLALKTFIRGLPPSIQTNIRLRNPSNLEEAMSFVVEEENFLYASRQTHHFNNVIQSPLQRPQANKHFGNPQNRNTFSPKPLPYNQYRPFSYEHNYRAPAYNPNTNYFNNNISNSSQRFTRPQIMQGQPFKSPNSSNAQRPNFNKHYGPFPRPQGQNPFIPPNFNNPITNQYKPTPMDISTNTRLNTQQVDDHYQDYYDYGHNDENYDQFPYFNDAPASEYQENQHMSYGFENNIQDLSLEPNQTSANYLGNDQESSPQVDSFFQHLASPAEKT